MNPIFRAAASLKLAVVVILVLAGSMTVGTFLESAYDTPTAGYYVYRATWFYGALVFLGINITAVAFSRWPWKRRHTPFLLAHLGIILLLFGSYLTQGYGVDGNMIIGEGEHSATVELSEQMLHVQSGEDVRSYRIPWKPPGVSFEPIRFEEFGFEIDKWIAHASSKTKFVASSSEPKDKKVAAAVHLHLTGGPMNLSKKVWLWSGDVKWAIHDFGPAQIAFLPESSKFSEKMPPGRFGHLEIVWNGKDFRYRSFSKSIANVGKGFIEGKLDSSKGFVQQTFEPGWMGLKAEVIDWIPKAVAQTKFAQARIQYGPRAPSPAIRLHSLHGDESVWVAYRDRARVDVKIDGEPTTIGVIFQPRRAIVPFRLGLERFQIENYPGTQSPREYWSKVRVITTETSDPIVVSMNEPLDRGGFTFYQSSYIPDVPRPVVSIFSVNRDPGRWIKYVGSILLVLGAVLLFVMKSYRRRGT